MMPAMITPMISMKTVAPSFSFGHGSGRRCAVPGPLVVMRRPAGCAAESELGSSCVDMLKGEQIAEADLTDWRKPPSDCMPGTSSTTRRRRTVRRRMVTQQDVDLARQITEIADHDGNQGVVCVDVSAAKKN